MSLEPDKGQLRIEADRFREQMQALPRGYQTEDYVVESYPVESFQPKAHLKKMMTEAQYRDLCVILNALHESNEEHVGESIIEVNVYFSLTGDHQALQDLMLLWTQSFLVARASKYNPKDGDDEFQRFDRLLGEYLKIFPDPAHSLCYLVTGPCTVYAAHLIYEHTLGKVFVTRDTDDAVEVSASVPVRRDQMEHLESLMQLFQSQFGRDNLSAFYRIVLAKGIPDKLREKQRMPEGALRGSIRRMGEDINTMRQLLVRDFAPDNTVIRLSRDFVIAVAWAAHSGIMNLYFAETESELFDSPTATLGRGRVLFLARNGALLDGNRPWIRMEDVVPCGEVSGLAVNAYILEAVHEKLFGFYDDVDETRLRNLAATDSIPEDRKDEVLAWSCQELAAREPVEMEIGTVDAGAVPGPVATEGDREAVEAEPEAETVEAEPSYEAIEAKPEIGPVETPVDEEQPRRRRLVIHHLRLPTFLRILEHNLGCEVRPGKGDETTIFRPGGKIFCIGRPGPIYPVVVKRALHRLNISTLEWLRAVNRSASSRSREG